MSTNRIEAFSDGVIAVIITIMVLEMKVPRDTTLTSLLVLPARPQARGERKPDVVRRGRME